VALCGKDSAPPPLALRDKENVDMNNTLENPSGVSAIVKLVIRSASQQQQAVQGHVRELRKGLPDRGAPTILRRLETYLPRGSGVIKLVLSRSAIHEDVPRSERRIPPRPKSVGGQAKR
ncbi:hypothetical protein FOZ63_024573, partial [Perkinsus olseni]